MTEDTRRNRPAPHASNTDTEDELAFARLVRRTLARWPFIAGCSIIGAAAAFAVSSSQPKQYESTTTLRLNQLDVGSLFLSQNVQQAGQDAETKVATYTKMITYPRVREAASRALGGHPTAAQLLKQVTVKADPDTTLIQIAARDRQPRVAARVADEMRIAYMAISRQQAVSELSGPRQEVLDELSHMSRAEKSSTVGLAARDRLAQIDALRAASNGGVQAVQTARINSNPVAPRPKLIAVLGLLVGGFFGGTLALFRARGDDHIRDTAELTDMWDLPVLGLIPTSASLKSDAGTLVSASTTEAFALARTNLRYLHVGGHVKTVVITSAVASEGKSTIAWNLALAAALADTRVLLVDADLRRPTLAARLGLSAALGLSDVLAGLAPVDDAITSVSIPQAGGVATRFDVLASGIVPPSPIALLERVETKTLLEHLKESYDLIVIDTPPATTVADAKVLLAHADGVVIVSRLGRVTRTAITRLRDMISGLDTPVLGLIVNGGADEEEFAYATDPERERDADELSAGRNTVASRSRAEAAPGAPRH